MGEQRLYIYSSQRLCVADPDANTDRYPCPESNSNADAKCNCDGVTDCNANIDANPNRDTVTDSNANGDHNSNEWTSADDQSRSGIDIHFFNGHVPVDCW
jgi:hypothetical protein